MSDSQPQRATCPVHGTPFLAVPTAEGGTALSCPACALLPPSPLGPLSQGAAANHELVLTYVAAGFSRTEAMQALCCIIQASIMKGSGGG